MKTLIKKSLLVLMIAFITVFALGVTNKVKAAKYVEKTSFGEGKMLITTTYDDTTYYLPTATATSGGTVLAKSFTDVDTISEDQLWTVTADGDNYYIQNSAGKYLYTTSANNGVRVSDTQHSWKYDAEANSLQETTTSRFLGIYNAQDWRSYTTVDADNYKESSTSFKFYSVNSAAPSISIEGGNYTEVGDVVSLTAIPNNTTGGVMWSSSDSNIATVDQSGNVTAKAFGQTTITATVDNISAEHKFTVYPTEGSELTIAEALKVCEYTGTTNCAFTYSVTGVITSIDTEYSAEHNNITVTINDGNDSIKAYRMSGGSELVVNNKIIVTGTLVNYNNNTPEFIAGASYVAIADDDATAAVKEALNKINAYMSMAYTYTANEFSAPSSYKIIAKDSGVGNGVAVPDLTNGAVTLKFNKGTNSNPSKYYTSGEAFRCYGGNTITFESNDSNVNITRIELTFGSSDGSNGITADCGTYKDGVWTGESNKVVLTIGGTSGNRRIATIDTSYEGDSNLKIFEYSEVDFRIKCGADLALSNIENVDEWGIKVSTSDIDARFYNETSPYYKKDDANDDDETDIDCHYVIISLGDVLNNIDRATTEFTVCAYVVVDGITYVSEETAKYSVVSMIDYYFNTLKIGDVKNLYEILDEKGLFTE